MGDLRAAAQQEPVAWMSPASESMIGKTDENGSAYHIITTSKKTANNAVPLYTHPPRREWQGLTDEEIGDVFQAARNAKLGSANDNSRHRLSVVEIARAIEAALKEKNHE
jgi:hypothetical protein